VAVQTTRVALFPTCLTDTLFPDTARAVVRLLERLGCTVEFPLDATCCGQMHYNTGYRDHAVPLAETLARAFRGYEAVIAPSGSCVGMVREIHPKLTNGSTETGSLRKLPSVAMYELSEFLVDVLGVTDVGAYFPHRVTYHPTCHSLRLLGVGDRPFQLLESVRGLELIELDEAESCCGFGGTFAVKNSDTSTAMLTDKMWNVLGTGAEFVTAGDNSCLMHIGGGLSRLRSGVRAVHLAEILASTEEEPWVATR
jgi:L-lactate dehydrogenase complex protein LldE